MPHHAEVASASRWTDVVRALGALVAVAAAAVGLATPATAEANEYLGALQHR